MLRDRVIPHENKIINIPFEIEYDSFEMMDIIIHGKRLISLISKSNFFPQTTNLYNWHELCFITSVYFLKKEDIINSITGIGLYNDKLILQLHERSFPRYIQVSTPCPKWLLDIYRKIERSS